MADAVSVLRQEISKLEKELAKRRSALATLTGTGPSMKRPVPAAKKPQTTGKSASRPAPGAPSLAQRIMSHLTANRDKQFSSADIAGVLAKTDKTVTRENVQRRLSELVKGKKLRRNEGRYGLP